MRRVWVYKKPKVMKSDTVQSYGHSQADTSPVGFQSYGLVKEDTTSETTFPITAESMTSDVVPNAPTAGEEVAPISTSSFVDPHSTGIQDVNT